MVWATRGCLGGYISTLWQTVTEKVTYRRRGFFGVSVSEGLPRSGPWGSGDTHGTGAVVERLLLQHEVERKTLAWPRPLKFFLDNSIQIFKYEPLGTILF